MDEYEIKVSGGTSNPYINHRIVAERPLTSGQMSKLILAETWIGEEAPDWWVRFKIRRLRKRAERALENERTALERSRELTQRIEEAL